MLRTFLSMGACFPLLETIYQVTRVTDHFSAAPPTPPNSQLSKILNTCTNYVTHDVSHFLCLVRLPFSRFDGFHFRLLVSPLGLHLDTVSAIPLHHWFPFRPFRRFLNNRTSRLRLSCAAVGRHLQLCGRLLLRGCRGCRLNLHIRMDRTPFLSVCWGCRLRRGLQGPLRCLRCSTVVDCRGYPRVHRGTRQQLIDKLHDANLFTHVKETAGSSLSGQTKVRVSKHHEARVFLKAARDCVGRESRKMCAVHVEAMGWFIRIWQSQQAQGHGNVAM